MVARIADPGGNELLLRRYGRARTGCAIFFPGQHGERAAYRLTLFRMLVDAGVSVFAVSYPGQDGAAGSASLDEIPALSRRAVVVVTQQCGPLRTVVLGRSLGSMVAVYAAQGTAPAGIVLDSAAPSLSAAISARIRSRWYLRPLALLPVNTLLSREYSLADGLARSPMVHVVVFQGTADRRTPLLDLERAGLPPSNVRIVAVAQATHANTYWLAQNAYVNAVLAFITGQRSPGGRCRLVRDR